MSKGSVWNKGKHNGGTGRQGINKKGANDRPTPLEVVTPESEAMNNRINSVKPMKRDNTTVRPARIVHKEVKIDK